MRRSLLLLFLVLFLGASGALAALKSIEIYRNGLFLVEEVRLKGGENLVPLLGQVELSRVEFLEVSRGLELVSLSLTEVEPQNELYAKLKALRQKEKDLSWERDKLSQEVTLIREALKGGKEPLSPREFQGYLSLFEEKNTRLKALEEELEGVGRKIKDLERKVSLDKVSALRILARGSGSLLLRYPAPKDLFSFRDSYSLILESGEKRLKVRPEFVLVQKAGEELGPLELRFYPRTRRFRRLAPPPFSPWIISAEAFSPRLFMEKAASVVKRLKAPGLEREEAESGFWERLVLKGVRLLPGENVLPLPEEVIAVEKVLVEVPLYAGPEAYFKATFRPEVSFPRLFARLYLDGAFVGQAKVGPFEARKEASLYFGPAHLVEVKYEVLKDLSGDSFWGKRVKERVTRAKITNHYPKALSFEVVDRVPVSRKKEIEVKAEAEPPWDKMEPNGKVIWRFTLAPEKEKTILLKIKIRRPKDE